MVRQFLRLSRLALVVCCVLLGMAAVVRAFPPLPSSFWGSVELNGVDLPDGTLVEALIDGQVFAYGQTQTYQGYSVYTLDIPGDDASTAAVEGGQEGDVILFRVGGIPANEKATWHSGTNVSLDLAAASSATPLTPQPTRTPLPTQTPISSAPAPVPPAPAVVPTATDVPEAQAALTAPEPAGSESSPLAPAVETVASVESTGPAPASAETGATLPSPKTGGRLIYWIAIPAAVLSVCLVLGIRHLRKGE